MLREMCLNVYSFLPANPANTYTRADVGADLFARKQLNEWIIYFVIINLINLALSVLVLCV